MAQPDLKEQLMSDLAQARATAQEGAATRGVAPSSAETFVPRAIRMGKRVVGEQELQKNNQAIHDAVEHLLSETSITDELEQEKFRSNMTKKLNQIRMLTIEKAGNLKLEMQRKGLDSAKAAAVAGQWGDIMSNVGQGLVQNIGHGGGGGAGLGAAPGTSSGEAAPAPQGMGYEEMSPGII